MNERPAAPRPQEVEDARVSVCTVLRVHALIEAAGHGGMAHALAALLMNGHVR